MAAPWFVGDEVTAAGYRLAGVRTRVPARGAETAALRDACADAPLVIVAAATAVHVDPPTLRAALAALAPLVVVVPGAADDMVPPDIAVRLRTQLGLQA